MALPATEAFTGTAGALTTGYQQLSMGVASRTVNRDGSGHGITNVSGVDTFAYDTANTYNNDQYSQEVVSSTSGGSPEPIVRASGTGTTGSGYFTYLSSGAIGIGKYIGGTFTDKGSVAGSYAASDVVRLEVSGTGITLKKNGTTVTTATDSSLTSGAAGAGLDNSIAILIDDWEGGNLGASSITGTASGSFALTGAAQGAVLIQAAASGLSASAARRPALSVPRPFQVSRAAYLASQGLRRLHRSCRALRREHSLSPAARPLQRSCKAPRRERSHSLDRRKVSLARWPRSWAPPPARSLCRALHRAAR